jgi:hypothetical protein
MPAPQPIQEITMPIHVSRTLRRDREGSKRRSAAVVLAFAATGYVVGALVHGALPPPSDPAAFAQPVQAATSSGDSLPVAATLATVPGADKLRASGAGIEDPRECDLPKGISTSCIFMD